MNTRLVTIFAAAALTVALTSCSFEIGTGSDDTTTTSTTTTVAEGISFDEWVDATNASCEQFQTEFDAAGAAATEDEMAQDAAQILNSFVDELNTTGVPEENQADVERFIEVYTLAADAFNEVANGDASLDDAYNTLTEYDDEMTALVDELGVTACGDEEADDTTLTVAEYAAAADDLCADLNDQYAEEFAAFADDPQTGAYGILGFLNATRAALSTLDAPQDENITELNIGLADFAAHLGDYTNLVEAAESTTAVQAAMSDDIDTINAAADALGAPACGGF